jgi:hypothetical protein
MAEYYLDHQGQIYADVAYRLGVIVKQYDERVSKEDRKNFDSTLCITFLQSLLTIYQELFRNGNGYPISRKEKFYSNKTSIFDDNCLDIKAEWVLRNSFIGKSDSVENLVTHLRNALSHPTAVNVNSNIIATGYFADSYQDEKITGYVFVDSPDVNKFNEVKSFDNLSQFEIYFKKNGKYPFEFEIVNGRYFILNPRICVVRLSVLEIKNLVLKLSAFLAQPIQKYWNGENVNLNILEYAA